MAGDPAAAAVEDEELDQLVNDIEELREAMTVATPKRSSRREAQGGAREPMMPAEHDAPAHPEPELREFHGSGDEPSMEETLAELREEDDPAPRGRSLLDEPVDTAAGDEVVADDEAGEAGEMEGEETMMGSGKRERGGEASEDGSLTMSVRGNMTLKLKYECDGQEVMVGVQGDSLWVQLADGTEFKIPVRRAGGRMRSAA